jgi:hypothetical protein
LQPFVPSSSVTTGALAALALPPDIAAVSTTASPESATNAPPRRPVVAEILRPIVMHILKFGVRHAER